MHDKIALLMEETGCDQGEAELALEMSGYEVEKAVKAIPRLLKNIAVLKGKFVHPELHQFGLVLVVLNLKTKTLLRTRSVLSYNPAVYAVSLDKDWFEFEKNLYGCRLWEGSLQTESQEVELRLAEFYRANPGCAAFSRAGAEEGGGSAQEVASVLKGIFHDGVPALTLKREILDLGTYQSLRSSLEAGQSPAAKADAKRRDAKPDETLVLKIALDEDPAGIAAADLRAGDIVSARIVDPRDIAQYLSKLLGGYSQAGPQPIPAPVEAIEAGASGILVRARFAVGACGDASLSRESRLKVVRSEERESLPWWRRFFKAR